MQAIARLALNYFNWTNSRRAIAYDFNLIVAKSSIRHLRWGWIATLRLAIVPTNKQLARSDIVFLVCGILLSIINNPDNVQSL